MWAVRWNRILAETRALFINLATLPHLSRAQTYCKLWIDKSTFNTRLVRFTIHRTRKIVGEMDGQLRNTIKKSITQSVNAQHSRFHDNEINTGVWTELQLRTMNVLINTKHFDAPIVDSVKVFSSENVLLHYTK